MRKIVLTGGGTGGHVIPHLSILDALKKDFEVHYIGTDGIEKDIMKDTGVVYHTIKATKLDRSKKLKNLSMPFKFLASIRACKKILKEINPDIIFSKGGYVSLPVVIAGKKLKIKTISHESDYSIGLANKIIYKYSDVFCTSFKETAENRSKAVVTGSPIRKSLFNGKKENGYKLAPIDKTKQTILFMGGSTGAKALNDAVIKALPELTKNYNIINIVGKGKGSNTSMKGYYPLEYVSHIEDIFAISDYIVSRAGSNAIFEFVALKKPTILVPLPKGASRGDQIENAKSFESQGLTHTLYQEDITTESLLKAIEKLKQDSPRLIQNMSKAKLQDGADNLLKEIYKLVNK